MHSPILHLSKRGAMRASCRGLLWGSSVAVGLLLAGTPNGVPPTAAQPAKPQAPILRIEPGVHSAAVTSVAADSACSRLVTGSTDKTVRVWGLPPSASRSEGQAVGPLTLARTLRPPISAGDSGRVYAAALSPDGRLIAASGWFGSSDKSSRDWVYLFDAATGEVARVLGPMPHRANSLAFSPKGDYLAATLMGGHGLRVWETKRWQLVSADWRYTDVAGAVFDERGDVLTFSFDGYVRLYPASAVATAGNALTPKTKVKSRPGFKPRYISTHAASNRVAIAYLNSSVIDVLDASTLRPLYAAGQGPTVGHSFTAVAWSVDGGRLYGAGNRGGDGTFIRIWDDAGKGQSRDVAAGTRQEILELVPCGQGFAFSSPDPVLGVIDGDGRRTAWQPSVIGSRGGSVFDAIAASGDGMRVRFGLGEGGSAPVLFDIKTERLAETADPVPDLHEAETKSVPVSDWMNSETPKLDGKRIAFDKYERAYALAIAPEEKRFVLGTSYMLRAYDRAGKLAWAKAQGAGFAHGVNIPRSGKLVIAAYGDGTVRWHRLSDGQELLALFVHAVDRRWVAWTPKGYYMASPGAESLIGWHVNRGWNEAAQFFPVDRFRDQFNRPDIVKLVLETLDEEQAIEDANKRGKLKRAADDIRAIAPPTVVIRSPQDGSTFRSREVTIDYEVLSMTGQSVANVDVRVNNAALGARAPGNIDKSTPARMTLTLPPQDVVVSLVAREGPRASEPASIRLRWNGAKPGQMALPRLRALFVGINKYTSPGLPELDYAAKDATDLAAFFTAQEGRTYSKVEARVLPEARRADLIKGLDWLERGSEDDDVNLLFLAGHGATIDQHFYFMAADSDPAEPRATAISKDEIVRTISKRRGAMIVMLDACHSGATMDRMPPVASPGRVDMNRLVNELSDKSLGVLVYASANGRQFSYEHPDWQNGAFTRAMLEGLSGKADHHKRGYVDTEELSSYVRFRVKELTNELQEPVRIKPGPEPEMRIVLLN